MRRRPPTAVIPDMALVTDISGECKAGVTPHTVWYPTIPAKPNVVNIEVNAGFGAAIPRLNIVPIPEKKEIGIPPNWCKF